MVKKKQTTASADPARTLLSLRRAAEIVQCGTATLRDAMERGELLFWRVEMRAGRTTLCTTRKALADYCELRIPYLKRGTYAEHRGKLAQYLLEYEREFGCGIT